MRKERNPSTEESFKGLFAEMVKAGVIKVVGNELDHGRVVPVYDAVPPEEWSPEARALMEARGVDIPRLIAEGPKD